MPIEQHQTITLASAEVSDAYQVELTVRDALSGAVATVSLSWSQTQDLVDELLKTRSDAESAYWEDRARPTFEHGFDADSGAVMSWAGTSIVAAPAICRDCSEGKHGACIGSAHVERGDEIDEVDCKCTADGHRGRS